MMDPKDSWKLHITNCMCIIDGWVNLKVVLQFIKMWFIFYDFYNPLLAY